MPSMAPSLPLLRDPQGSLADAVRSGLLHSSRPAPPAPLTDRSGSCDTPDADDDAASWCGSHGPPASEPSVEGLDLPKALVMLLDVARGMAYLHARNVVHADLKSEEGLRALRALPEHDAVALADRREGVFQRYPGAGRPWRNPLPRAAPAAPHALPLQLGR
jgi:hypothetical protein